MALQWDMNVTQTQVGMGTSEKVEDKPGCVRPRVFFHEANLNTVSPKQHLCERFRDSQMDNPAFSTPQRPQHRPLVKLHVDQERAMPLPSCKEQEGRARMCRTKRWK